MEAEQGVTATDGGRVGARAQRRCQPQLPKPHRYTFLLSVLFCFLSHLVRFFSWCVFLLMCVEERVVGVWCWSCGLCLRCDGRCGHSAECVVCGVRSPPDLPKHSELISCGGTDCMASCDVRILRFVLVLFLDGHIMEAKKTTFPKE